MIRFRFEPRSAVEAVLYLAYRSKEPTSHHISKLLYFADQLHLERYGSFMFGDTYIAMKNGPVPSGVYDMLKDARGDNGGFFRYPEAAGAFAVVNGFHISPGRVPDLDWLSDSNIACLDEAIEQYDNHSFSDLTRLSHDSAWESAGPNDVISVESIVERIGNPDGLLEHLLDPNP